MTWTPWVGEPVQVRAEKWLSSEDTSPCGVVVAVDWEPGFDVLYGVCHGPNRYSAWRGGDLERWEPPCPVAGMDVGGAA